MWKKLQTRTLLRHPRLTVVEDEVQLPGGKKISYMRFDKARDAVCVICFKGGKLLLGREYSYPPGEMLLQFPGGSMNDGETPEVAARRELHEEADLLADQLTPLGSFYMNNRRSKAKMHVFTAQNPREDKGQPDDEEDIISEWLDVAKFQNLIAAGQITNSVTLSAWAIYCSRFATTDRCLAS